MAVYGAMALTQAGIALYSKAQSGTAVNFTRFQIGSGQLTGGQTAATMTALNTPIAYFPINQITVNGNTALVLGIYSNSSLNSSTYTCEIGIFAQDPVAGEILYAYANAGTQGDTIPPISAGPLSKQFQISIAIGNATSVTATVPAVNYVPTTQVGAANGVAPLDANSFVPIANLPKAVSQIYASVRNFQLTSTVATNVLSFTPSVSGNLLVHVYFRVVTFATNVSIEIDYADSTGAQANITLPSASQNVGSHSMISLFIEAVSGTPVVVKVQAGTANQVFITSSIVGAG